MSPTESPDWTGKQQTEGEERRRGEEIGRKVRERGWWKGKKTVEIISNVRVTNKIQTHSPY